MNVNKLKKEPNAKNTIDIIVKDIPESVMRELAIATLEWAKKFYEDPENVRKFEEWRKNRKTLRH